MNELIHLSEEPIRLRTARVSRTYSGGRLLEEAQGYPSPCDSFQPEEWVASLIEARNSEAETVSDECLSFALMADGTEVSLKKVLHSNPELFFGSAHVKKFDKNPAFLVKLIDSAERLTIQVHPDKQFAKEIFNSDFGKAEAWYIIGTRIIDGEEPYLLIGFKPGVTKEKWKDIFDRQDIPEMIDCLHKIRPMPGETYMIESGVPHAIGPGCFLVEIQEPTDFTLRTEKRTPYGKALPEFLVHQGAGYDKLFDCFHYRIKTYEQMKESYCAAPKTIVSQAGGTETELIAPKAGAPFHMTAIETAESFVCTNNGAFSIIIVLSGQGSIQWNGGAYDLDASSRLFLPFGLKEFTLVNKNGIDNPLKAVRCFPPFAD